MIRFVTLSRDTSGCVNHYASRQVPVTYVQPNRYVTKEQVYQQTNELPKQPPPPQYYNEYQQQPAFPSKVIAPSQYEPQQFVYQPEVLVGNQLQTVQQKVVTAKYSKNGNKGTLIALLVKCTI